LPSESEIKEIKDWIKDVDGFLTASSENDLFEGHEAQTNARTDRIGAPFLGPLMNIAAHIRFS
jgi:hypothetical protein